MNPIDRTLVDESVTDEDFELALQDPTTVFPAVEAQDELEHGDTLVAKGIMTVVPATPAQAIANARRLRDQHVNVGAGMCLATVRGPIFHLPALWPTAEEAAAHGAPIHRVKDLREIPRGAVIGFTNNHVGHVTLGLGGGLNSTTDYHELGYEGVATIENTAQWCGATDVFWYETLCGFDVWPDPAKPEPEPKPFTLEERLKVLQRRERALRKDGADHRAARLHLWVEQLQKRLEARGK